MKGRIYKKLKSDKLHRKIIAVDRAATIDDYRIFSAIVKAGIYHSGLGFVQIITSNIWKYTGRKYTLSQIKKTIEFLQGSCFGVHKDLGNDEVEAVFAGPAIERYLVLSVEGEKLYMIYISKELMFYSKAFYELHRDGDFFYDRRYVKE